VAAGLRMLAARVSAQAGAERAALALAEEAFRCDPGSAAAAELERQYRAAGRTDDVLRVLEAELEASERAGRREASRALRFRLALQAADAGRTEQALATLAPLRAERDRAAALWSWELARAGKQPALEAAVLAEPGVADALASRSHDGTGLRLLALAEAHEASGDRPGAAARHQALAAWAEDNDLPVARLEAALGLFRTQPVAEAGNGAETPASTAFAALARAAGDLPGAGALAREAELLALATGGPPLAATAEAPASLAEGAFAGAGPWLWSLREHDPAARTSALAHLAEAADDGVSGVGAGEGAATAGLWAVTGVRQLLTGEPGAAASLARAGRAGPDGTLPGLIAVALTDLGGAQPAGGALAGLRVQRAERLAGEGPAGALLAETLLLEQAEQAEAEGRGDEAAECYARVLALAPESLDATEGLRRLAQSVGHRRAEAAALVRLGGLLRDPRRATERFAEAALLFEEEGLREDAAQAFSEVLARVPDDDEAYRRLHALMAGSGRHQALEQLLSFKLGRTVEPSLRVALLGERAALRAGPLGKPREAVLDHRRILALAPEEPESLRFLARLASEEGRFALAIPLYEGALAHREEDEHSTALRLELAEAYEGAQRDADAVSVLREAVEAQPKETGPRERLIALAQRHRDHALAAEQLQALEALTTRPGQRAGLAVRRGRIERDQRHDRNAALGAFRTALELEPLGEAAGELLLTVGDEPLGPAEAMVVNHVIANLRHELAVDPFDVRRLECLRDLAGLRGQGDLRDVAAQLLAALGVGSARGRARDIVRPVSVPALGALGGAGDRDTPPAVALANEIWPHFADGVARLYPRDPAELGASRQTRIEAGLEPRLAWAESASVALGIPSLSFYVGGYEDLAVNAFDVPEACLVLGRGVVGGDPASRFRVGRALALMRQRATVLDRISLVDLEMAFAAAGWLAAEQPHPRIDTTTLKSTAKRLAKALSRRELKSLESYEEAWSGGHIDVRAWKDAVLRTADRFGLLVAADLAVALRILAGGKAGPAPGALSPAELRGPACFDLVLFALGDRYRNLRREVGLSRDER
jgi:tetratricopeptide (TPR) repeat protein